MTVKIDEGQIKFLAISCMEDMCTCIARMYSLCVMLGVTEASFKEAIREFIEGLVEAEKVRLLDMSKK